ncbi:MAG TPA: hypothetical protein VGD84_13065 [Pseudonocardiaceae bacterium]
MDDDQAARLTAAWGSEWHARLSPELDTRWGADWQANPAEHKHAWFTYLITELLAEDTEPEGVADMFRDVGRDDCNRECPPGADPQQWIGARQSDVSSSEK